MVDSKQKPLLSSATCEQLGLLTVNHQERVNALTVQKDTPVTTKVISSPLTQECIINKYSDVFKGLGTLPGEYHMDIDTKVKAVQAQPRRVAVALKSELKKEIEEMERRGVIAKVTTSTEWIAVWLPCGNLREN